MPYNAGFFSPTSIPWEIECKTNLGDAFQAKRGGLDEAKAGQGCDRRQEVPISKVTKGGNWDMKPFVALQTGINFSQTFYKTLEYHLHEGAAIIDPTPGEKHSWNYYLTEMQKPSFLPLMKFDIAFIKDDISNFLKTKKHVSKKGPADAIFFDPPYIFGHKQKKDSRCKDYGGYEHTFKDIENLIINANLELPTFLKEEGLLFFKYTDVFSMGDRKYYFCAFLWPKILTNFKVIDHYIIQHHHVSPTAWQVENRPCGIVNYTYLTIFKKREGAGMTVEI